MQLLSERCYNPAQPSPAQPSPAQPSPAQPFALVALIVTSRTFSSLYEFLPDTAMPTRIMEIAGALLHRFVDVGFLLFRRLGVFLFVRGGVFGLLFFLFLLFA